MKLSLDECNHLFSCVVCWWFSYFDFFLGDGKLEAMENMVKYKRDECLGHPLVRMFINKKLSSPRVAKLLILNTSFYIAFLMSLTIYVGLQTGGKKYKLKMPASTKLWVLKHKKCKRIIKF